MKKGIGAAFVVGACVGIWAACGGTPGGGSGGDTFCTNLIASFPDSSIACSCNDISAGGSCNDLGPSSYCTNTYQPQVTGGGACPSSGGETFTMGSACPTANRVGTCYDAANGNARFYSPQYTTASAQTLCKQSGSGCFVAN